MRATAESTVVLRPQELRLKRRANSDAWQIHYKIGSHKKWFRNLSNSRSI